MDGIPATGDISGLFNLDELAQNLTLNPGGNNVDFVGILVLFPSESPGMEVDIIGFNPVLLVDSNAITLTEGDYIATASDKNYAVRELLPSNTGLIRARLEQI